MKKTFAKKNIIIVVGAFLAGVVLVVWGGIQNDAPNSRFFESDGENVRGETESAATELANWLIGEGYAYLRSERKTQAMAVAELARYFEPKSAANGLIASLNAHAQKTLTLTEKSSNEKLKGENLLSEARRLLKDGLISEAKLALLAAIESEPQNENAKKLLNEIDGMGDLKPFKPDHSAEGEALYRDGLKLKDEGDIAGARLKLKKAVDLISKEKPLPPFAADLKKEWSDISLRFEDIFKPKLQMIEGEIERASSLDAPRAIDQIIEAKKKAEEIVRSNPDWEAARQIADGSDTAMKAAAGRWLASAQAAEALSACAKARAIYSEIQTRLSDILPDAAASAKDGANRCR